MSDSGATSGPVSGPVDNPAPGDPSAATDHHAAPRQAPPVAAGDPAGEAAAPPAQFDVFVEMVDLDSLPPDFATDRLNVADLAEATSAALAAASAPLAPAPAPAPSAAASPATTAGPGGGTTGTAATPSAAPPSASPATYAAPYIVAAFDAAVAAYDAPGTTILPETVAAPPIAPDAPTSATADSGAEPPRDVYTGPYTVADQRYATGFLSFLAPGALGSGGLSPERRAELARRYALPANPDSGRFRGIEPKLTREDIAWLLSSHESRGIQGPVDWNDDEHRRRIGLDLRGADLSGLDLSELPLARVRFGPSSGEWLGMTLAQREASVAHLEGANLRGTHLEGALLRGAYLQGADLSEALLTQATLVAAHLDGATLEQAQAEDAHFGEVFASSADLRGAHLAGADLHGAHLDRGNLSGAHLERAKLDGAHLEQATLDAAHLDGSALNGAFLEGALLNGAHLDGANLYDAHLEWAQATGAHLAGALLNGAHLESCTLNGAHLEGADLREAHLEGASLRAAHLEGADLRRATFNEQTALADVVLGAKNQESAALGDIRWGAADLTQIDWRPVKRLGDERAARAARGRDGGEALRAVPRAYRQLAAQLRGQGMTEEADRFTYRAILCQRGNLLRHGHVIQYAFSWFLTLLTGYGYRPGRALVWYLLVVAAFALAYLQLAPGGLGAALAAGPSQWWAALVLSVTSFHGRGFFPLGQDQSSPMALLMVGEAVIGLGIELTFLITTAMRYLSAK